MLKSLFIQKVDYITKKKKKIHCTSESISWERKLTTVNKQLQYV